MIHADIFDETTPPERDEIDVLNDRLDLARQRLLDAEDRQVSPKELAGLGEQVDLAMDALGDALPF